MWNSDPYRMPKARQPLVGENAQNSDKRKKSESEWTNRKFILGGKYKEVEIVFLLLRNDARIYFQLTLSKAHSRLNFWIFNAHFMLHWN